MDIAVNEKVQIIDLCTPSFDVNDTTVSIASEVIVKSLSTSNTINDRFPNLHRRLSILPCYPTNNSDDQGDPLLSNIPRMYKRYKFYAFILFSKL